MLTERLPPREVRAGDFDPVGHFYPRVLNAHINPLVQAFMHMSNGRIVERYIHLNPQVSREAIEQRLTHVPRYYRWGGTDLLHTASDRGERQLVVIETNSCPSGQKSMPLLDEGQEQAGYRVLLEGAFLPQLKKRPPNTGALAVLYDKNYMEASGYAATLADLTGEVVHLVPCWDGDPDPVHRFDDGVLHIRTAKGTWLPIRAALRYVTQRPWNRIPPLTKTLMFNPVIICLAGGRNKMLAAKAYEFFNGELRGQGMQIHTPETVWDVAREEIPMWVQRMGGFAVVKVPYSNAGQGVYTITSAVELKAFMESEQPYDRYIVQALIGNLRWSSTTSAGRLYHVGTVPNKHRAIHVADLRFMVGAGPEGFFPVAIYARRARKPLTDKLEDAASSWEMLGTNLSVKMANNTWDTESSRLLLMDSRDFNRLGLGLDDLIEAYIQTVLSVTAIDEMAKSLVTQKGRFRRRLFKGVNPDASLTDEIMEGSGA